MSCTVEWALERIRAAHPEEHLPCEKFLRALHDEEYAGDPFFRLPSAPATPFYLPHIEGPQFTRPSAYSYED